MDNFARFRLSEILIYENNDYQSGEKYLKAILQTKDFMRSETYEMLGDIEFHKAEKGKVEAFKNAVVNYHESIKYRPGRVNPYVKLGQTNEKLREFDDAITAYEKALRRDSSNFLAQYRLGCVLIKEGRKNDGIQALNAAHMLDSEDVSTLVKLGEIYAKIDSKQHEAMNMLKKAIAQEFEIPEAHMTLGRIYEKMGNEDMARDEFQIGVKQSMKGSVARVSSQSNFYLGCLHERRKELK